MRDEREDENLTEDVDWIDILIRQFPDRVKTFMENIQDSINMRISESVIRMILFMLFIVEVIFLFIVISSTDSISDQIREIYGCTTVGGFMNVGIKAFPYLLREFLLASEFADMMQRVENESNLLQTLLGNSQWLMSGSLAILVSCLNREMKMLGFSFLKRVIHSVLFTFFCGEMTLTFLNRFVWGSSGLAIWVLRFKNSGHIIAFLTLVILVIVIGFGFLLLSVSELFDELANLLGSLLILLGFGAAVSFAPEILSGGIKTGLLVAVIAVCALLMLVFSRSIKHAVKIMISFIMVAGSFVFAAIGLQLLAGRTINQTIVSQIYGYTVSLSDEAYAVFAILFTVAFNMFAALDDDVEYDI